MSVLRVYGKDFHSIQSQKVGTRWNFLQMSWKTSDQLLKHSTLIICFSLIWSAIDVVVVIELLQSNNCSWKGLLGSWSSFTTSGRKPSATMFSQTVLELRRKSTLCTLGPPITWKGILNTIQNSQLSIPTRFIDEQDGGRDRSASPNYHSLIYGKKPSEKELASNGAEVKTDKFPL